MRYLFVITLSVLVLASCASPGIRVYSEPGEVDVFLVQANRAPKKIGVTPLNLDERDFDWGQNNGVQLKFVKDGYKTESIVLPKTKLPSNSSVHALMEKDESNLACQAQGEALRKVAEAVAKSQNFIYKKQFDRAESLLQNLSLDYPNVSVIHDLLGNVYYLRKDLNRSLEAYRRSDTIWPNNIETKRMIRRLEGILNSPSSQVGG